MSAGYWGSWDLEPSQTCGHLPVDPLPSGGGMRSLTPRETPPCQPFSRTASKTRTSTCKAPQQTQFTCTAGTRRLISQNALRGTMSQTTSGRKDREQPHTQKHASAPPLHAVGPFRPPPAWFRTVSPLPPMTAQPHVQPLVKP